MAGPRCGRALAVLWARVPTGRYRALSFCSEPGRQDRLPGRPGSRRASGAPAHLLPDPSLEPPTASTRPPSFLGLEGGGSKEILLGLEDLVGETKEGVRRERGARKSTGWYWLALSMWVPHPNLASWLQLNPTSCPIRPRTGEPRQEGDSLEEMASLPPSCKL